MCSHSHVIQTYNVTIMDTKDCVPTRRAGMVWA